MIKKYDVLPAKSLRHHCATERLYQRVPRETLKRSTGFRHRVTSISGGFDRCPRSEHEFERSRMACSRSTGSHARWRDRRGLKEDEDEDEKKKKKKKKRRRWPTLHRRHAILQHSRSLRALRATQHWQVISCTQLPATGIAW